MTESIRIDRSADLAAACERFAADVSAWADACQARYLDAPAIDGHDQGTFTTSWGPAIAREPAAVDFCKTLRDRVRAHFVRTDQWRHGYWRTQIGRAHV